jgi:hypothetical protein
MKTPISEKRLAANRANAVRSTGPRSAEGKTRSAQNARKHGFTAASFSVLPIEDVDELKTFRAEAVHVYQPVNSEELFAVERIALSKLSILRAARLEAGMFTDILDVALNDDNLTPLVAQPSLLADSPAVHKDQLRSHALATGINRMMRTPNAFSLLLRYQALAERQYRRAVQEFDRLKSLRGELPNEPIEDPETEEIQPDTQLQNEPVDTPPAPSFTTFPLLPPGFRRLPNRTQPRAPWSAT